MTSEEIQAWLRTIQKKYLALYARAAELLNSD
jgi:hypothetical protein